MINTNKVRLFEEFAAGEISNPEQNVAPAGNVNSTSIPVDKTKIEASGEQVRAEIIKDVDAILTNLETLSKRISENIDKDFFFEGLINESLEGIIGFVKQQANWAKGMALINGDWKKLKLEGNSDIIAGKEHDALAKIEASIDKMKRARDEATGPKKDAIQQKAIATIAKLKDNKADISSKFEEAKEAAAQALEDVEEKLKKYEDNMPGGTEGDLYFNTKRKIGNGIKMDGLKEKARVAKEKGKTDAAKEAADELKKIGVRSKEADEAIKELSADVDPKLEEQINKIQNEIDREKDEDLASIQSTISDLKKSLSDDDKIKSDPKLKKETEAKLERAKEQEDKTLEGIYYLEDYLEELKAQRAALKGEDYDKAESKVGSTEDDEGKEKEGLGVMGDEEEKTEQEPEEKTALQKAEDKLAKATDKLQSDEAEVENKKSEIANVKADIEKLNSEKGGFDKEKQIKKAEAEYDAAVQTHRNDMDKISQAEFPTPEEATLANNKANMKLAKANLALAQAKGETNDIEKFTGQIADLEKEAGKVQKKFDNDEKRKSETKRLEDAIEDKLGQIMNQEDLVKQKEEEMMKYSSFAEPDSDEAKKYKDAKKAYDAERKNLRRTKEEVEELRIDLKRAKNIGLAEAKSSGQAAAAEVVQDEIDDKKEEIENIEAEIKRIESDVIPKDEEDVAAAKQKVDDLRKGEFDDIKKKQKQKSKKNESKELTWESLKEDLGLNQKVEKVHESFSIADRIRLILNR
tara:strand:+ start:539 stop:2785 length:2247 start_codon:yes stop_codon:yes gene_type:complete